MTAFFYWTGVVFWAAFAVMVIVGIYFSVRYKLDDIGWDPNEDIQHDEYRW